jgi:ATP-dependent Clp protease adapter protein ClpS
VSQFPADQPDVPRLPHQPPAGPPPGRPGRRELPRCKVVLHADPALDLMFVVRSIMELTRFPRAEATHKMWATQHDGSSVLLSTYRERAELYAEQFAARGLTVTVEPA